MIGKSKNDRNPIFIFQMLKLCLHEKGLPIYHHASLWNLWCPGAESNHRHGDFQFYNYEI